MTTFPGAARPSPRGWPDGITPGFVEVGANPSTGAGFQAPIASVAKFGLLYFEKVGTGATDWILIPGSGTDWASSAERRAVIAAGLTAGRYTKIHEPFTAPGQTSADFGPNWATPVVGGGAQIGHQTAGGALWRGGVAVIEQPAAWTDNHLLWGGPGLFLDGASERGAAVVRYMRYVAPAPSVNNNHYVGLADAAVATFVLFGYDENADPLNCIVYRSGLAVTPTSIPIATLNAETELMFAQVGATVNVYVNGVLAASVASAGRMQATKPYLGANRGTFVFDDVLVLCNGALA